jgi:DNA-binding PadR family transcriptional regulator
MSLRYALLGFISTEPASGFDLAREFGESMGWFWYASHGSPSSPSPTAPWYCAP